MKNIVKNLLLVSVALAFTGCGDKADAPAKAEPTASTKAEPAKAAPKVAKAEPKKAALKKVDFKDDLGIGPVKTPMTLTALDDALAEKGKAIYKAKCTACHKLKKRYIGPGLKGVTKRRRAEWIMNMILNPEEMVIKNAAAKALLQEYSAPMANQSLKTEEARALLEYFRRVDSK